MKVKVEDLDKLEHFNTVIFTNIRNLDKNDKVDIFFPARTISTSRENLEATLLLICGSLTVKAQRDLERGDIFFDYIIFTEEEVQETLSKLDELFGEDGHPYGKSNYSYH